MMRILIAPNAFKGSLDACSAAARIRLGLADSGLKGEFVECPVGDGGDGTAALLTAALGGETRQAIVKNPLGRPVGVSFGWIKAQRTAVIELANASGLRLLDKTEYDPLRSTTEGTGELFLEALNAGASTILLCVGGSATVDGGTGIAKALGVHFLDEAGQELNPLPERLDALAHVDITEIDKRIYSTRIITLCDVRNRLLGLSGAAAVFGPQKGAGPKEVVLLEAGLQRLRDIWFRQSGIDLDKLEHGGAAGGVAAGLAGLFHAQLVDGTGYFLEHCGFDVLLKNADLVITGEGSLDAQTLGGKAPYGVALRAAVRGIPVIAFAGSVTGRQELGRYFKEMITINRPGATLEEAMQETGAQLYAAARALGSRLMAGT